MAAGRLVVVSGANRGVGLGIVHQLLQLDREAHVAVLARSLPSAEQACASLEGGSGSRAPVLGFPESFIFLFVGGFRGGLCGLSLGTTQKSIEQTRRGLIGRR